jgi:hypothetical protein
MKETSDELLEVMGQLILFADEHPRLREILVRLGRVLIQLERTELAPEAIAAQETDAATVIASPPQPVPMPPPEAGPPQGVPPPPSPAGLWRPTVVVEPQVPVVPRAAATELRDEQLPLVAERFELKADGCDWHVKRRQLIERGADFQFEIAPNDRLILDRARSLEGCWMWMCRPESPTPEPSLMEVAAQCYRNAAKATRLVIRLRDGAAGSGDYPASLQLLAEALSALRAAVADIDDYVDADQNALFFWLRRETFATSIYVQRHMQLDDPADPQYWLDLQTRLSDLESKLEQAQRAQRERSNRFGKVKFHIGKLGSSFGEDAAEHSQKVVDAVTELVRSGVKPSSVELRDVLLPNLDLVSGDSVRGSPEFDLVLNEIDRYVASREAEDPRPAVSSPSPDVLALRQVLGGKALVLVGGNERRASSAALVEAFGLSRLDWQSSLPHQSSLLHGDQQLLREVR